MDRKGRKNGITIRQSFQMLNFLSFGLRWDILFTDLQLLRTPRFHRSKNVDENIQNFERIPDVWSKELNKVDIMGRMQPSKIGKEWY